MFFIPHFISDTLWVASTTTHLCRMLLLLPMLHTLCPIISQHRRFLTYSRLWHSAKGCLLHPVCIPASPRLGLISHTGLPSSLCWVFHLSLPFFSCVNAFLIPTLGSEPCFCPSWLLHLMQTTTLLSLPYLMVLRLDCSGRERKG